MLRRLLVPFSPLFSPFALPVKLVNLQPICRFRPPLLWGWPWNSPNLVSELLTQNCCDVLHFCSFLGSVAHSFQQELDYWIIVASKLLANVWDLQNVMKSYWFSSANFLEESCWTCLCLQLLEFIRQFFMLRMRLLARHNIHQNSSNSRNPHPWFGTKLRLSGIPYFDPNSSGPWALRRRLARCGQRFPEDLPVAAASLGQQQCFTNRQTKTR